MSLREYDLRARGAASLVEEWKNQHEEVQQLWKVEDLIELYTGLMECGHNLVKHFAKNGASPSGHRDLTRFIASSRRFIVGGSQLLGLIKMFESEGYEVAGAGKLTEQLDDFEEAIDEVDWPERAAFAGGALDDWN